MHCYHMSMLNRQLEPRGSIHYVKCIMSCIYDEISKVQITMLGSIKSIFVEKHSMLTWTGVRHDLSLVTVCLAVENTYSAGVKVSGRVR